jgi:predicted AAA+ superfamily ATPase
MRLLAEHLKDAAALYYLDLEDPRLINFTSEDFEHSYSLWMATQSRYPERVVMFFDEPHNVPGWERWMTHFASRPGHSVVLTGSNSHMLSSELATFLTGRHRVVALSPFSFAEVAAAAPLGLNTESARSVGNAIQLYERYRSLGGFPRVWLGGEVELLTQYFKDIVLKDISARRGAAPAQTNIELGVTLMTNAARLTNKTKLAKQLGFKQPRTIARHISAMQDAFLFRELRIFSPALKKQQRSLPKFYPVDHALARAVRFSVVDDRSLALECMVASELWRRGYELFYWRSSQEWEVDFIARKSGSGTIAVQVTLDLSNPAVFERESRALQACAEELGITELMVVTEMDRREIKLGRLRAIASPFYEWAVGNWQDSP